MKIVVLGAGAVGSVLGGLFALQKHEVLLVCRECHRKAIEENGGLRVRSATGDYLAQVGAVTKLAARDLVEGTCVFLTAKSYDTEKCTEELSAIAPRSIPIVCFQNGVSNEEIVASKFDNVYGGVCRMTCSMIQGGQVSFRGLGRVIVGKYPKGSDALARELVAALTEIGCKSCVSRNIMNDKWLKLAVNTQSTLHAIIDPRDHDSNEFLQLKVNILEETKKVLKAHKVRARSCDGKDMTVDELIADLRRPKASRHTSGVKVGNSTWQNLYLKRPDIENRYYHGPIIELGRKYNIPVPFNEVALEMVERVHRDRLGPESLRLAEILDVIAERTSRS
jgi:2-dehydropantoate 2-reductase